MTDCDYIPTGKFCFELNGQYFCTNDVHAANLYYAIKRITERDDDAATPWLWILEGLMRDIAGFAGDRSGVDESVLFEVRKNFAMALEIYRMAVDTTPAMYEIATGNIDSERRVGECDMDAIRGMLAECVAGIRSMDEHSGPGENSRRAAGQKLDEVPILLSVKALHKTRDMSVSGQYESGLTLLFNALHEGQPIDAAALGCGSIIVDKLSENGIALYWGRDRYSLKIGERITTESYLVDNPYLSCDMVSLSFEYRRTTRYDIALDILSEICEAHDKIRQCIYLDTTAREEKVLYLLDKAIEEGTIEAYPLKALLAASVNWSTRKIVRPELFRQILLEGVGAGCLSPDCPRAWKWLAVAAENNDPDCFMEDRQRYLGLLSAAAEKGIAIAGRIMDGIREPDEQ